MTQIDVLALAVVVAAVWGMTGFGLVIREHVLVWVGAVANVLLWLYMIVGNVDVVRSTVTEGCNALTGVCTVTTTTTTLLNLVPVQSSTVPLGGVLGILLMVFSIAWLWIAAHV